METLLNPLHLSHHRLEHGLLKVMCHLVLLVLEAQVHLILHLSRQALNLTGHALLHGCEIWVKVPSWRSPLWLHWRLWRWHNMLCCSCSHVSIIITVTVRPGTAGLLIDIECSRVRDNSWMYLTSFVTIRIGIELAAVQRKLPNCVVVGLQLYSARTFHVIMSPRIYKGGQGPPPNNHQHLRQYNPHRT